MILKKNSEDYNKKTHKQHNVYCSFFYLYPLQVFMAICIIFI